MICVLSSTSSEFSSSLLLGLWNLLSGLSSDSLSSESSSGSSDSFCSTSTIGLSETSESALDSDGLVNVADLSFTISADSSLYTPSASVSTTSSTVSSSRASETSSG